MSAMYRLRTASLDRLGRLSATQPYETGMMEAILIGDTTKLDKVWTEQCRSTGTFHALVISGVDFCCASALFRLRRRNC